jgi:uncharacterized protein YdeI (YjbR/CyaY-like superfamily)
MLFDLKKISEEETMTERQRNPKVDAFLSRAKKWNEELEQLRELVLDCELTEELKWGVPCYTYQDRNVVLIHGFKEYCALLFFNGALMKDPKGILIQQTANVQAGRQIRFTSQQEIAKQKATLKSYIRDAIAVEKSGVKLEYKKTEEFSVPDEFQTKLDKLPKLKTAFESLTPGRQRAYILHFSSAKQSSTRNSRVEKCMPQIMEGKGLQD